MVYTGKGKIVVGIDPGNEGAFVVTDGVELIEVFMMPKSVERILAFADVMDILVSIRNTYQPAGVFLERALPMAMGSGGAFTYGRNFQTLVVAIGLSFIPMVMVEPSKWTKLMHQGINSKLKPKAKSEIAVKRLFPRLAQVMPKRPKKGDLLDGPVDALLIAAYGLRTLSEYVIEVDQIGDFY